MECQEVLVKRSNDGDDVAGILHEIGITGGFLLDGISPVGDGGSGEHGSSP